MTEIKPYGMTVGELRSALADAPADAPVVVRTNDEWGENGAVGGVLGAQMEQGCADTPAFLIDASNDHDEFELAEAARAEQAPRCPLCGCCPATFKDGRCQACGGPSK